VSARAVALAVCLALGTGHADAARGADLAFGTGTARLSRGTGAWGDDLAFGAGPAAPSERDIAYELGVQAEAAGDDSRAAAAFERAYRLTAPAESGPRLLFLRASVAAWLRVDDRAPLARNQLCRAQALLRDHLGAAPAVAPDPLADERASLELVEQRLAAIAGPGCAALVDGAGGAAASTGAATPDPRPTTATTAGSAPDTASPAAPGASPASARAAPDSGASPASAGAAPGTRPAPRRPALTRALWIAGGLGLGLGAAAFATLAAGVVLARKAEDRGQTACVEQPAACNTNGPEVREIVADGRRADLMVRAGAALGGLGVIAAVVLFAVGERTRRRARVTLTPRLAPGWTGVGVAGRF